MINMKNNLKAQKGSALLYAILLISGLAIIAQLCFSLLIFSIGSRRHSYNSTVNYWIAWGGVELGLVKIKEYQYKPIDQKTTAWCYWPNENNLPNSKNTIEKNEFIEYALFPYSTPVFLDSLSSLPSPEKYILRLSLSYFTSEADRVNNKIILSKDESTVFDLSKFGGTFKFKFIPDLNSENNLVWMRVSERGSGRVIEGVIKFNRVLQALEEKGALFGGEGASPLFQVFLEQCSLVGTQKECSFTIRPLVENLNLFKIKVFGGKLGVTEVSIEGGKYLGLPYTIIHSIGYHGKENIELYVKFPNALQGSSDIWDYSLYQASF